MNLEELLRDERTRPGPHTLDARVDLIVAAVRRRRRARKAAAGAAGLATVTAGVVLTLQLTGLPVGFLPATTTQSAPSSSGPAPNGVRSWGPGTPFIAIDGAPYVGTERWRDKRVGSFTVLTSGVVYIDLTTSQVVLAGWDGTTTVIGQAPWYAEADTTDGGVRNHLSQYRNLVGSVTGDLVVWVERDGDQRGDLVVVEASTGAVLGRTPVPGPPDQRVIVAGVTADVVHFGVGPSDRPFAADDVWEWRWSAGEPPRRPEPLDTDDLVMDVSGDIWAVDNGRLEFRDGAGTVLFGVEVHYEDETYFGGALSPDGGLWYAPAAGEVVITATGERVPLPRPSFTRYGWTGSTTLTFIDARGLFTCDAITGACSEPIPVPASRCDDADAYCGYDLPAY